MASTIARTARRLRARSGYSQARLSKLARISQAWVYPLETGDENPTLASLTRIARALDVEVPELLANPSEEVA